MDRMIKDIYDVVIKFRLAIMEAKLNREFAFNDRMCGFPYGCCDDASDLLAYYLKTEYNIFSKQGNGVYAEGDFECITNHSWLIMNDNSIIDITADQFDEIVECREGVYIGKETTFYKKLDRKVVYENYNIAKDKRLWEIYQKIRKYMMQQ